VGIDRQRRAESLEELGVLARVRQVILPRITWVICIVMSSNDIDQMKHRIAVRADDDEIFSSVRSTRPRIASLMTCGSPEILKEDRAVFS